ncbi:MAG: 30S ribosomal protein S6 [Desulforegulaceae bacterium]|nr:30S ribosomal protein S6 [Desulforegulaceae bacterium]
MKRYETIIVMDPDTGKETWEEIYGRMISQIETSGGIHLKTDEWGSLKLAYEIRKKTRGNYFRIEYCTPAALIAEIERYFRLDERITRYLTVLIDDNPDIEQIKAEMLEKETDSEAAKEAVEETTETVVEETVSDSAEEASTETKTEEDL